MNMPSRLKTNWSWSMPGMPDEHAKHTAYATWCMKWPVGSSREMILSSSTERNRMCARTGISSMKAEQMRRQVRIIRIIVHRSCTERKADLSRDWAEYDEDICSNNKYC